MDEIVNSVSALSANPAASRIPPSQAGPQKYEPSPVKAGYPGKDGDEEDNYYEHEYPEVIVEEKNERSNRSQSRQSRRSSTYEVKRDRLEDSNQDQRAQASSRDTNQRSTIPKQLTGGEQSGPKLNDLGRRSEETMKRPGT